LTLCITGRHGISTTMMSENPPHPHHNHSLIKSIWHPSIQRWASQRFPCKLRLFAHLKFLKAVLFPNISLWIIAPPTTLLVTSEPETSSSHGGGFWWLAGALEHFMHVLELKSSRGRVGRINSIWGYIAQHRRQKLPIQPRINKKSAIPNLPLRTYSPWREWKRQVNNIL
jgi:hypothetical protein